MQYDRDMQRRALLTALVSAGTVTTGCLGNDGTDEDTDRIPASQALVIESKVPVDGTMVNLGVEGVAKNDASETLVDCVVDVTGEVGDETFDGRVTRDELPPGETWDWEVSFGEEADASDDDSVEDISITTRANYAE